jgi:Mrp family chromosome partitioning ATPase
MTKIYEALQQFDIEQSVSKQSGLVQTGEKEPSLSVLPLSTRDIEVPPALTEILIGLYRTIFTAVPGPGGRIIQFVDSGKGSGNSKLIRAFAKVSSSVLKKSVLLLDSDPQLPSNFDFFNQKSTLKWMNELKKNRDKNSSASLPDKNLLSVSRLSMDSGFLPVDTGSPQTKELMEKLKDTFDLILVDSWSIAVPPKPRLFSPHVDGIVMVIDAGKTRWQIAEKQKRELTAQGGNVLGVILNNRTYPIPDSIYNRLYG